MQTWEIVPRSAFFSNSSNLQYAIMACSGPFQFFLGTSRNLTLGGKKATRGERVREKRANKMALIWIPPVVFGAVALHIFMAIWKR